jgi:hypothetical protein
MGMEAAVGWAKYYRGICVKWLRKATEILSQNSRWSGREAN